MSSWKSNPFVALGLLIVTLGAGWLTYRTVKEPKHHIRYSYVLMCTNPDCPNPHRDRLYIASYPKGKEPPFDCPFCGSPSYFALRCRLCGRTFSSFNNPFPRPPYFCQNCRKRTALPLEPGQVTPEPPSPGQ